jgi:serine/threonine-protein kinase
MPATLEKPEGNGGKHKQKMRRVLPADVVLDASRRFSIATASMGVVLLVLIIERTLGYPASAPWYTFEAFTALLSFVLAALSRANKISPSRIMDVAVFYELLLAFAPSYMEFSVEGGAARVRQGGISWSCLVIVLFPALVPTTPTRGLAAGLAAASMGPLAYVLALLFHEDHPLALFDSAMLFLDNYIAGFLAVVPCLVFTKLARDVVDAREMGSYTLEKKLGSGGMGEVWRARHRLLARPAAVKLIRPEAIGGPEGEGLNVLGRFEREARATAALRSPHTVVLYDFGLAEGSFYYVMELLDGLDVETLVERFGALPPARVVYLLRQACLSLDEAHRAGLVHRDIKPANIYVCRLGTEYDFVKLLDFGLVKTLLEGPEAARLSSTNMIYGTPAYMPPEQAKGDPVTPQTDLYALGCVAYYMLTGRVVFEAKTTAQILIDHVQRAPEPPSQRARRVLPPDLEAIVLRCLEKEPQRRPDSAHDLYLALGACSVGSDWDDRKAAAWWQENLPDLVLHETLPAAV